VPIEMLDSALKSLCAQEFDNVFSRESTIKLEWRLRITITILEQMCRNECQFTIQFLDDIRQATSMYKDVHSKIIQHLMNQANLSKALNTITIANIFSKSLRIH